MSFPTGPSNALDDVRIEATINGNIVGTQNMTVVGIFLVTVHG